MAETEPFSVYDAIAAAADQFSAIAWQKLGLHPDMMTGTINADLAQAKVAIDLVAHLSQLIDIQLDSDDRRQMQSLVRDLRLNYVEKCKELPQ